MIMKYAPPRIWNMEVGDPPPRANGRSLIYERSTAPPPVITVYLVRARAAPHRARRRRAVGSVALRTARGVLVAAYRFPRSPSADADRRPRASDRVLRSRGAREQSDAPALSAAAAPPCRA
ncbi:hypothetical protein EVAR_53126_1 [Eumeta japonica]|uniref:Uncharacterized protein n=1 Tax=Eumeta variegata TaxID=151549 RepID=A0A4C1Y8K5_EUMVA|nr:hypothetical protein EVAR_53126_1 [Eumeta japonica]